MIGIEIEKHVVWRCKATKTCCCFDAICLIYCDKDTTFGDEENGYLTRRTAAEVETSLKSGQTSHRWPYAEADYLDCLRSTLSVNQLHLHNDC